MLTRLLFTCSLSAAILFAQNPPPIRSWADAEKLEASLDSHPDDLNTRVQLLNYYSQQLGTPDPPAQAKPLRRKHVLWFIEHHPEQTILSSRNALIDPSGNPSADPEGYAQCSAAWQKVLAAPKPLFDTYANASWFYTTSDPPRARRIAEEGLRRYPGNYRIAAKLGMLMAYSIAGVRTFDRNGRAVSFDEAQIKSPEAQRDRKTLETSDDTFLIDGAARTLQGQCYQPNSPHRQDMEDLIVRLYRHADVIDPNSGRWRSTVQGSYRFFASLAATPAEKVALLEKALAAAPNPQSGLSFQETSVLPELAQQYLNAGNTAKAAATANEVLNSEQSKSSPNYGNNILTANMVLGRIALQRGDAREAAIRLLAAGRAPATDALSNFGPSDWTLAEDLLAAGDRDTVLAYLDLLRALWKNDNGRLNTWTSTIRNGGTPNFTGPNGFPKSRFLGRPAPEFRLKDLHGAEVALADFKGKVVLLDFWATWCGPCREEMPEFQKIHSELGAKDVVVVALDVNEPLETVARYIDKEKFTFRVLLGNETGVVERYNIQAYPTTFAIDKNGLVADIIVGGGSLQALIEKARAGAPPAPAVSPVRTSTPASPPAPPATAEDLFRDAVRQHTAKDYTGAIQSLDRALQLRPDWAAAIAARADNQYHAKHYEEAIAGFTRAIQLDPKRAASYDGRGLAYSNSARHAQGIPDYTRAIELLPDFTAAYNNRGWAYLETGRLDDALADLNKAIDLNPAYVTALFNRAHLFEKRQEYAKAVADFESILHVEPANTSAANQKSADLRRVSDSAVPAVAAPPVSPAALVVGTPSKSNCAPFGCPWMLTDARPPLVAYQQAYDAAAFGSSPIRITAITFYAKLGRPGAITSAIYTFRLGSTDAKVGHLAPDRNQNLGRDAAIFWSGVLEGNVSGSFTVTATTPFVFDPRAGRNLVLDIGIAGQAVPPKTAPSTGFFDRDTMDSAITSRALFTSDTNGFNNAGGLVTGFTLSLAAPKLVSPADGEVFEHFPRTTTVVWSEVPGAAAYTVEWDYKEEQGWLSDRTGALGTVRTTKPVATFRFVGAQPGRWRVWAEDFAGATGPKSEWREFRYTH